MNVKEPSVQSCSCYILECRQLRLVSEKYEMCPIYLSTVVEHTLNDSELVGSNPARYSAFFSLSAYCVSIQVLRRGAKLLISP